MDRETQKLAIPNVPRDNENPMPFFQALRQTINVFTSAKKLHDRVVTFGDLQNVVVGGLNFVYPDATRYQRIRYIAGDVVRTGKIVSRDAETWFDLDNDNIVMNLKHKYSSTAAGVFLGRDEDSSDYKVNIGNATHYFKFSGSKISWAGLNTSLDEDGNFAASSATISGAITATSGTIGGWTIVDSTQGLWAGSDETRIMLRPIVGINMGADSFAGSPFSVSKKGVIKAESGTIGGNTLASTYIESVGFVAGAMGQGWRIENDGDAEFQNVIIRGKFKTTVFEKDTVSINNAILMITNGDVLDADMTAADASTMTISGDVTFSANEVLQMKDGVDNEYLLVTNAGSAPVYTVTRDLAGSYSANDNPTWQKGTAVASIGVGSGTKTGYIILDASSANSPFIDIYQRNSTTYSDISLKARLGWLKGITDADVGLDSSDEWGLYSDNVFLKGTIYAMLGKIGIWNITSTAIYTDGKTSYDDTTDGIWMGVDGESYKINIGNDDFYIKGYGGNMVLSGYLDQKFQIPEGIIIPFNDTSIPSNWERFTSMDGKHPIGAGDTYEVAATGGAQLAISEATSSAGTHTGSNVDCIFHAGATAQYSITGNGGSGGDHYHTVTGTFDREYQQLLFIKCTNGAVAFPAKGIVLCEDATTPLAGLSICYDDKYILRSGATITSAGGDVESKVCSTDGEHYHQDEGSTQGAGVLNGYRHISEGGHAHSGDIDITSEELKRAYLTAWTDTDSFKSATGMIAMWEGATAPDGWILCDGENDTIDLRDYFIILSDTGSAGDTHDETNRAYLEVSLDNSANVHSHATGPVTCSGILSHPHGSYTNTHGHTVSDQWLDYTPAYYALTFIQKE